MEELKLRTSLFRLTDSTLELDCAQTPVDDAISESGYEPDGYFWDSIVAYLCQQDAPEIVPAFATDPETDLWQAKSAEQDVLLRVKALLEPYLDDPDALTELISQAEADDFQIED